MQQLSKLELTWQPKVWQRYDQVIDVDRLSMCTYRTWQNRREFHISQGWLKRQRWPWNRGQTSSCPDQGLERNECCQSDRRRSKYPANTLSDATLNNTYAFSYTLQSSKSRYKNLQLYTYIELQWEKVKCLDIYREPDAQRFTVRRSVLIRIISRQCGAISGRPLPKRTDFGLAVCS